MQTLKLQSGIRYGNGKPYRGLHEAIGMPKWQRRSGGGDHLKPANLNAEGSRQKIRASSANFLRLCS